MLYYSDGPQDPMSPFGPGGPWDPGSSWGPISVSPCMGSYMLKERPNLLFTVIFSCNTT